MKSQRGVTVISVMVVIIIIIILAAASVFSSKDLLKETKFSKVYNEIYTVRNAMQELKTLNETYPDKYDMNKMLMGEKIEDISQYNPKVGWNLKDGNEYYYLGFGDSTVSDSLKRRMEEQLGVRDIEFSYIVGADDIEDIEVYLVDGVEVDGYYFYTYEDILNQYLKSKNG